jgi:hypothetical protein
VSAVIPPAKTADSRRQLRVQLRDLSISHQPNIDAAERRRLTRQSKVVLKQSQIAGDVDGAGRGEDEVRQSVEQLLALLVHRLAALGRTGRIRPGHILRVVLGDRLHAALAIALAEDGEDVVEHQPPDLGGELASLGRSLLGHTQKAASDRGWLLRDADPGVLTAREKHGLLGVDVTR